jgi:hypothetical protein
MTFSVRSLLLEVSLLQMCLLLITYACVLILRLMQIVVIHDRFSCSDIFRKSTVIFLIGMDWYVDKARDVCRTCIILGCVGP